VNSLDWSALRRDIGGKHVGDLRAFLYFVPFWWLLSMGASGFASTLNLFATQMLANAIAFVGCFFLLLVFQHTVFRHKHRRTVPLSTVISAGLALGGSKAAITLTITALLIGEWGNLEVSVARVLGGAVTGALFFIIAPILLEIQDRFRVARDVVFAKRLQTTEASQGVTLPEETQAKLTMIFREMRDAIDQNGGRPKELAQSLTALLEKKIRPLSRDLWSGPSSGKKYSDLSARELVRIVVSRNQYDPTLTALAMMLFSGPFLVFSVGWPEGVGRALIIGLSSWLVVNSLELLPSAPCPRGALVFSAGLVVFATSNEMVALLIFGQFAAISPLSSSLLNAVIFSVFALVVGIFRVAQSELRSLREELETLLGADYFGRRIGLEQAKAEHRKLAHVIHGRLQNQILGTILSVTNNRDTSSSKNLLREIEFLEKAVSSHDGLSRFDEGKTLSDELASLTLRWQGIIDITVLTDIPGNVPQASANILTGLAEEGVTNAVRHGLASSVAVGVTRDHGHWVLTIADDGVGPRQGLPGIGTLALNRLAGNSWSLDPNPSGVGSVLRVHVPIQSEKDVAHPGSHSELNFDIPGGS
jgi:two-component sensor histidine kinase